MSPAGGLSLDRRAPSIPPPPPHAPDPARAPVPGRYIIRHEWEGPIECDNPRRGIWGGPWPDVEGSSEPVAAQNLAFVQRDAVLGDFVTESAAARIEQDVGPLPKGPISAPRPLPISGGGGDGGCAHCSMNDDDGLLAGLALSSLGLLGALGVRRRRRRGDDPRGSKN